MTVHAMTARASRADRPSAGPAAVVLAGVLFLTLGVLAGWVWAQLAHPPEYTLYRRNYPYYSSEAEFRHAFEMDLVFTWIGAAGGLLGGLVVGWRWWRLGWVVAALTALAAAGAAVVAWRAGVFVGPGAVRAAAADVRVGDTFSGPVALGTRSLLLVWPVAALLGVMVSVWLRAPRDEVPAGTWTVDAV